MKKRILKSMVFLGLLSGAFISPLTYADETMPSLIEQFKSPDPDVRSVAFSSAIARPITEQKEAYENALIDLLKLETAYFNATPATELQDDDEWNAYYVHLIIAVAKLRNPDSIPALVDVMTKEDAVTQTLAGFGPSVLDLIYPKFNDPNQAIRLAAVTVVFEMLNPENEVKVTDHAVRNKMEAALKSVAHDGNATIRTTANEALTKLKALKKRPESTY